MMKVKTLSALTGLLLLFTYASFSQAPAQEKEHTKASATKKLLDSQNFVFVAQTVLPLRGGFRNLTSEYDVSVSKDSLVSYLPYFGRAYSAPINPLEGGLIFTSTKFTYSVTSAKNGWDVKIRPHDRSKASQLSFRIFNNGSASLFVTNVNRESISFQGYLKERAPVK